MWSQMSSSSFPQLHFIKISIILVKCLLQLRCCSSRVLHRFPSSLRRPVDLTRTFPMLNISDTSPRNLMSLHCLAHESASLTIHLIYLLFIAFMCGAKSPSIGSPSIYYTHDFGIYPCLYTLPFIIQAHHTFSIMWPTEELFPLKYQLHLQHLMICVT